MEKIRISTFTNWCNSKLPKSLYIQDLSDLANGVSLIMLLEHLTKESSPPPHLSPRSDEEAIENIQYALQLAQQKNIRIPADSSSKAIQRGDTKALSELIWALIVHFDIRHRHLGEGFPSMTPGDILMAFVTQQLPDREIRNFTFDWVDGSLLYALVSRFHALPDNQQSALAYAETAIAVAAERLGVPAVLSAQDLVGGNADNLALMTYIAGFRKAVTSLDDLKGPTLPSQTGLDQSGFVDLGPSSRPKEVNIESKASGKHTSSSSAAPAVARAPMFVDAGTPIIGHDRGVPVVYRAPMFVDAGTPIIGHDRAAPAVARAPMFVDAGTPIIGHDRGAPMVARAPMFVDAGTPIIGHDRVLSHNGQPSQRQSILYPVSICSTETCDSLGLTGQALLLLNEHVVQIISKQKRVLASWSWENIKRFGKDANMFSLEALLGGQYDVLHMSTFYADDIFSLASRYCSC